MYALIGAHPDISFAVNILAQHASAPSEPHLQVLKCVFHYLARTWEYCLIFNGWIKDSSFISYVDADWASNPNSCCSISGYIFLLSGCPISWAAKKQPSISLSSTESEYMAMTLATCEAVFLWQFLIELGFHPPSPIPICINNQLAIALACNLDFHAHTKHIEVHHHYICEKLKDEVIDHQYISLLIKLQTFSLNLSKQLNILNLLKDFLFLSQALAWRVCRSIQACAFLIQIMCIMYHFHKCWDMLFSPITLFSIAIIYIHHFFIGNLSSPHTCVKALSVCCLGII